MIIGRLQHDGYLHFSVGRQFMKPIDLNTKNKTGNIIF